MDYTNITGEKSNKAVIVGSMLFLFFLISEYPLLQEVIGWSNYGQKLFAIFSALFLVYYRKEWKYYWSYFSFKRLRRKDIQMGFAMLTVLVVYKVLSLVGVTILNVPVTQRIVEIANSGVLPYISPFLEEVFFTGIVFDTLWRTFASNRFFSNDNPESVKVWIIPFVITFYWFLLGHLYETDFLNRGFSFNHRIHAFPAVFSLLVASLCGKFVFVKSRSLIFPIIIHYAANGVVFAYIKWFM